MFKFQGIKIKVYESHEKYKVKAKQYEASIEVDLGIMAIDKKRDYRNNM